MIKPVASFDSPHDVAARRCGLQRRTRTDLQSDLGEAYVTFNVDF